MKERPILFSGHMVRALLDGSKTQTRRLMKPQPEMRPAPGGWLLCVPKKGQPETGLIWGNAMEQILEQCPHGVIGDRLWVREAWKVGAWRNDGRVAVDYLATPEMNRTPWCFPVDNAATANLILQCEKEARQSNCEEVDGRVIWEHGKSPCRARPSIHMPRAFSRLTLEIVDVKAQRLQDISEQDAEAEGIKRDMVGNIRKHFVDQETTASWPDEMPLFWAPGDDSDDWLCHTARDAFARLWDGINGETAPWESNPFVWSLSFRRVDS